MENRCSNRCNCSHISRAHLDQLDQRLSEEDDRWGREPNSDLILIGSVPMSGGVSLIGTSSTLLKPQISEDRRRIQQTSHHSFEGLQRRP
ncbi:hypothetical protein Bca52824_018790 [Brassica carinata]|uniref:Uncharacterized protein n=1 Tax=Brassica carinata TaxID=52824 RepID=A0A8X8AYZ6_BRACI|nr:hypothetical protein Bca52824_018790 [Brassica carinata]